MAARSPDAQTAAELEANGQVVLRSVRLPERVDGHDIACVFNSGTQCGGDHVGIRAAANAPLLGGQDGARVFLSSGGAHATQTLAICRALMGRHLSV